MDISDFVTWLKRATGLWYKSYGPLSDTVSIEAKSYELRTRTDTIVREVKQLERELQKIGYRIPTSRNLTI